MRTLHKFLVFLLLFGLLEAYKLNVPRVLLPYHPKIQVQFPLEVTGGCFHWKSTRPDVVSVEAVNPDPTGCSDKAVVTSKAKHEEEQSVVVFAENKDAGISLSCGVTVDVIHSVAITTTAKTLFIDASPVRMILEGFNKEGDRFSNLGEIPVDWYFDNQETERPLRIIPFSQSKYDAPAEIQKLEGEKQRGYVVLVEGILTGSATLTAKLSEPHFSKIQSNYIDLMVVANVLLVPSEDLYLPVHSIVRYGAVVIKQNSVEEIVFPSNQYSLELGDTSICKLDRQSSKVTALAIGKTDITLIDSNVKSKSGQKPQSAHIYVVDPDSIQFSIDRGGYWYLQKGVDYHINVVLLDSLGNKIFIPDNAVFDTRLSSDYFDVLGASKNGTYFHVKAKTSGYTVLRSKFTAMISEDGTEHRIMASVSGEQDVHISDKIEVKPYLLVFPYQPRHPYSFQLRATGGTGNYKWQSESPTIAGIDESKGLLKTGEIGHTVIRVEDVYNPTHFALAQVYVLEPAEVRWGESHLEAELESNLILNVRASGLEPKSRKLMSFTDCRLLDFQYSVFDRNVFRINTNYQSQIPEEARGCATVSLKALSSADTKVKVQFDRFADEQTISAFPPLVVSIKNELLLATGSEVKFAFEGGPRPWILDSRKYFTEAVPEVKEFVQITSNTDSYVLKCGSRVADTDVLVNVGNKRSPTNPLPVVATVKLAVCCSVPERMSLSPKPKSSNGKLPACPSFVHSIYHGYPSKLQLIGFGRCRNDEADVEKQFDSLTSVRAKYKVDIPSLLSVVPSTSQPDVDRIYSEAIPNSQTGIVNVAATVYIGSEQLLTSASLNLVGIPEALPPFLVLWNSKNAQGIVTVTGGSGHFWIDPKSVSQYVKAELIPHAQEGMAKIKFVPSNPGHAKLSLYDLCINGGRLLIDVWVSDVKKIKIIAPDIVELNSHVPLKIEVLGDEDRPFSAELVKLMGLEVGVQYESVKLQEEDLLNYSVRGVSVGTSVVTANVRNANGNIIKAVPHQVQVFAPLKLLPEVVTLIPEAVFQFEIVGGPQPLQNVEFKLNHSHLASVAENGLITSYKNLGETTVTAIVTSTGSNRHIVAQDTAVLRIVSLAGIRIRLSSNKVDAGESFTARIEGLDDREVPFAFGGAEYPFDVVWTVASKDAVLEQSPLTEIVKEGTLNKFSARFKALKSGLVTISATVKVHPKSTKHFRVFGSEFSDSVDVVLQERLGLVNPKVELESVLLTPETTFEMVANRRDQEISYSLIQRTKVISLSGARSSVITSGSIEGSVPVKILHHGSTFNETAFVTVDVLHVDSIELVAELPDVSSTNGPIPVLPQGMTVRIKVVMKDYRGRPFSATNNVLKFRPHRFDLTDITYDGHRSFMVHLKQPGETVFSVWDSLNPRLNAFIRLPVGDVLKPDWKNFVAGDLVCFHSPLLSNKAHRPSYEVADHGSRFLSRHSGCSVIQNPGESLIYAKLNPDFTNSTTYSALSIREPDIIHFKHNHPKFISNLVGEHHFFNVRFGNKNDDQKDNILGCEEDELQNFAEVKPPFECSVTFQGVSGDFTADKFFSVSSVFNINSASYACVLHDLGYRLDAYQLNAFEKAQLQVVATWKSTARLRGAVSVPFYPRFIVHDDQITLNNLDDVDAVLKISTVPGIVSSIEVEPCHANIISVERVRVKDGVGNAHFKVTLNVNSAALWSELSENCVLKVTSLETKQTESVYVKIKLFGDSKRVAINAYRYSGISGALLHFYETWLPSIVIILLLLAAAFIAYYGSYRNDTVVANTSFDQSSRINGLKPITSSTPTGFPNDTSSFSYRFPKKPKNESSDESSFNRSSSFGSTGDSALFGSRISGIRNRHYGN